MYYSIFEVKINSIIITASVLLFANILASKAANRTGLPMLTLIKVLEKSRSIILKLLNFSASLIRKLI